jgi:RNA exonuclease 1
LNRTIQTSVNGHDSYEDAEACIDLLSKKLENGLTFGTSHHDSISIVKRLQQCPVPRTTAIVDYGIPYWDEGQASAIASCATDDEVALRTVQLASSHSFVWARLRSLERVHSSLKPGDDPFEREEYKNCLVQLDETLAVIHKSLPPRTVMVVWSGHGDARRALEARRRRQKFQREFREEHRSKNWSEIQSSWTESDEFELVSLMKRARIGAALMCVVSERDDERQSKRSHSEPVSGNDE